MVGAGAAMFLIFQMRSTGDFYARLLSQEVRQEADARTMQVTFKKQVQEWKDVLLRGSDPAALKKYRDAFEARAQDVDDQSVALLHSVNDPQVREMVAEFAASHQTMDEAYRSALVEFQKSGGLKFADADRQVKGQDRAPTDLIDRTVDILSRRVSQAAAAKQASLAREQWIVVLLLAFSFVGSATLAFYAVRRLDRLFRETVRELVQGTQQVASAAGQVAAASQSMAQGSSQQAASIEETSASSRQVSAMTERNAENARLSFDLIAAAEASAAQANGNLREMEASMAEIDRSSHKIRGILGAIEGIAFQTNLLALNAAVEAARAGEAGMGFGVVADEVRNLAARSADSAKDSAVLVEESMRLASDGNRKLGRLAAAVHSMTTDVGKVQECIQQISKGCAEQLQGVHQVSSVLVQMTSVTQQSAASSEESAAAAEQLSAQAQAMRSVVLRLE